MNITTSDLSFNLTSTDKLVIILRELGIIEKLYHNVRIYQKRQPSSKNIPSYGLKMLRCRKMRTCFSLYLRKRLLQRICNYMFLQDQKEEEHPFPYLSSGQKWNSLIKISIPLLYRRLKFQTFIDILKEDSNSREFFK